ncbi:efflux RND transporter periplasmic adaptor subunit [Algoriphagus limi]|uniref:Efflux RND transporter periplasmic adaptor subunit n=1 Tax=Algoriphagus limi TaxID=2975273 RepID=A0ABT2G199_9BACT|nr:efflux RND transporter periplasmic adaptor subunit [Algoriphagus limi]MCS5488847.1 efflux RND transporter periplasmic adaptor subunit [Algoriphagus limi]
MNYRIHFILGFFLGFAFFSCSNSEETAISPQIQSITESVYASGNIKAVNQYEAYAIGTGPIQEIFVKEGDVVNEGDPILAVYNERERLSRENAELAQAFADYQENQSKLRELQLAIDLAKSKFQNDSLLYARQKKLWEQNIGTEVEFEQRKLTYENSKNNYESALIRYGDLKREIEYNSKSASKNLAISRVLESEFVVKSKIHGKVYALPKEQGEMVGPQTVVAVLGDEKDFIMELLVDEYDISKIALDQLVIIRMDSYVDQTFEGKVTKIYPLMDTQSKSFTVEAVFTKSPPVLYPNLSLEANIITAQVENALVIPRNYLLNDEKVILEEGDTIVVKVGLKNFEFAQILEGLNQDQQLIKP